MKKVLFFASDYKIGLSSLLTDQLLAFFHEGMNITALAGEKEQESGLSNRVEHVNNKLLTRIEGLDEHSNFKQLAQTICQIILANNIYIVHVQNNWQLALMAYIKCFLLRKHKVKVVYTLHGFRHNSKWKSLVAQIIIGTALLCFADKIICMSSYLKKKFKLLSYKIELIPLGVSKSFFTNSIISLPSDGLHLIFPAQFRFGKNQDCIIRAFAEHIHRTGDLSSRLVLPGSGDLLPKMKDLVNQLGISQRVFFPGQLSKDEIRELYLKSNIGIVSSNSETFGQSIVEPFVLGRCVISTPVGIANDIIKKEENGYIYKSQAELVQILDHLYYNQHLIQKIGEKNFKMKEMFSWEVVSSVYQTKIVDKL